MDFSFAPIMRAVVDDRLYIVQGLDTLPLCDSFRWFTPHDSIKYYPLCDDFGPLNMVSVLAFSKQLDAELSAYPFCRFFFRADEGERNLTNAIFLLGAYMILMIGSSPCDISCGRIFVSFTTFVLPWESRGSSRRELSV